MKDYKKEIYYYRKPHHVFAVFCSNSYIKFIDPEGNKFKIADNWFTLNHWQLLTETIFNTNKIQHEVTID